MACAFALFLSGALTPALLRAQAPETGSVQGRVLNADNGRYLKNARVTVAGTAQEAFTDEFGNYALVNLPAGEQKLTVFFTGLQPQDEVVSVAPGRTAQADFQLTAQAAAKEGQVVKLDAYVVATARETSGAAIAINEQRFSPNPISVVSADAFGDVTEGNVGEFLKYLPGVSVDYVAADVRTVSVRGLPSNYTPVSVDGFRMASASSGGSSRTFEFEQISLNNVSRIEVVKEPTADMPADSLGGAVNMISKSAFDYAGRQFKYRGYMSMNSEDRTLAATAGPANTNTHKLLPGADFSFIDPVSKNFGFVITGLSSNQFNPQHRANPQWVPNGMASTLTTADNPYLRKYTLQDGPKKTNRDSLAFGANWRLGGADVLTWEAQYNYYNSFFGNRNLNWDVGTTKPAAWGPDFTTSAAGKGSVAFGSSFREKYGGTYQTDLRYRHTGRVWNISGGAFFTHAESHYRDTTGGHFENIGVGIKNVTVAYTGITPVRPAVLAVTDSKGAAVDVYNLANYTINTAQSQPVDASDLFKGGQVDFERKLDTAAPTSLKAGASVRREDRDIKRRKFNWTFVGPDGKAGTADDIATQIADTTYTGQYPGFGFQAPPWPSPYKLYQLYVAHPKYFTFDQVAAIQNNVQNSFKLNETISAAYAMAKTQLLRNRLTLLGGVRFERTADAGDGFLYDPAAIYQRNASGQIVRDAKGNPVPVTTDPVQQARLQYHERAAHAGKGYDGYYPSFGAVYNLTDNLLARLAYARTLGRPDFSQILPGTTIDDINQSIIVNNTGLKPWQSQNCDLSLEYYFKPAGVVSAGVFRKDLTDFFGKITETATPELLAQYGLADQYAGYNLSTQNNAGSARITGTEFNYVQQLVFLPGWTRGFSLFANGTFLHLEGSRTADFSGFIAKTVNWGLSYGGGPANVMLKWNYRGRQRIAALAFAPDGYDYYKPRTTVDVNFECRLRKNLSVFLNGRNIFNVAQDEERFSAALTPDYARLYRREQFGVQWAAGVKGSF